MFSNLSFSIFNKYYFCSWVVTRNILLSVCFFISALISAQLPEGFIRERIATGLNPTSMVMAPDRRIFLTEKNGKVRVIRDDQLLDEPMLSIEVDENNERGLAHIVLHPDFEMNGYFYIYYSIPFLRFNRISRFTANGDKAIPGSEVVIMNMDKTESDTHNGGAMLFGLDGYLYVSTGEGFQYWPSEDLTSTNGKVLRIDDLGNAVPDNPWFGLDAGSSNKIYAYGLRNPFTMSMHPLTGDIYVNDVGNLKFEEINKIVKGAFYGWPRLEGKATGQKLPPEYMDPVFQYAHENHYCCIAGSVFYNPETPQFPESYIGKYFYSDYCTGHIHMLDVETGIDKGVFISDGDRVIDMLVSPAGNFYYLERKGIGDGSQEDNTSTYEGTLWRVTYSGSGKPFISIQPESTLSAVGDEVVFNVKAFGAIPLTYKWYFNGMEVTGNEQSSFAIDHASIDQDSSTVYVIVSNSSGQIVSDTAFLYVTNNHRPELNITSPGENVLYEAGDTVFFSGSGDDEEDGTLPPSGLSWRIDFHHDSHSHPGMPWMSGISEGAWVIPSVGETSSDVWYRIYLKATDSEGFSGIAYRDVFPRLGNIEVTSFPSGLNINLDGTVTETPYMFRGVAGVSRYVTAPLKQFYGDSVYFFEKWIDGVKIANREIKASHQDQLFKGNFVSIAKGRGHGLTAKYYDNIDFNGLPVVTKIDSVINHQFFETAPDPLVPADNFSIQWDGFLQAYRGGTYTFTLAGDDGIHLEVNGQVIVDKLEPGIHLEKGSIHMEGGYLYPVRLKMFDGFFNAQIKLRWSSPDFSEEVIPSSQLYPEDYLTKANTSGVIAVRTLSYNELLVLTESYKESKVDFTIVNVIGQPFIFREVEVHVGKNTISIDIHDLPAGIYFLTGVDSLSGRKNAERFVKVN
ncbi:MAG TPA: PQQ-dependent sugar dehydrogenase [Saprospiraceae bacterium]|nr:PQQ-dependent sugar dehydrogenase [Saprospiraceae bacterium]